MYAPACANEWRQGICEKPRVACRDCQYRELLPLSDEAIYGHLAGDHTLGLYPLLENDHCHLLAVDFDKQDWRDDARAFLRSCRELELSSYDRLFPNQDTLPKGGFGNLIALPLQKEARQRGCSVFVDDDLQPYRAACAAPLLGVISRAYRRHRHCCWPIADLTWLESVNRC